jgi:hypothetical protein
LSYQAFFQEHKKLRTVPLLFGVVTQLQKRSEGLSAIMLDPDTNQEYRFWVSKKKNPLGSRCQVYLRKGDSLPTISRNKADFEVKESTVVLFVRPRNRASAFPVVSWEEYQAALPKVPTKAITEPVGHKRDHRWVDPPPLHGSNNAPSRE